jgi:hypothetical protein
MSFDLRNRKCRTMTDYQNEARKLSTHYVNCGWSGDGRSGFLFSTLARFCFGLLAPLPLNWLGIWRSKTCCSRRMRSVLLSVFITTLFFFNLVASDSNADELDGLLENWISQNVHFEKDRNGRQYLFIRKQSVRAYIESDDEKIVADARMAVANLAKAFGLDYEFTGADANLLVVVAPHITIDGRPNRLLLQRLKVPDRIAETIVAHGNWVKGCGLYDGHDLDGRLSIGMVIAEREAPPEEIRTCAVTGVIFGFGLRIDGKATIDRPNDYVQFLLLARAITVCEKKLNREVIGNPNNDSDGELKCLRDAIRSKLVE